MKFENLGLIRPILNALEEQGYQQPTPIQEQAIPAALAGRDVLGCARTGTGKTCAFSAPILQRLSAAPKAGRPIRALILTPTRELAIQIQECIEAYAAHLNINSVVIFGGVGQNPQVEAIQSGCDILVATPGRLEDLHNQGFIDVSQLEIFVLDEADRMLDMGFIHDVKKILSWLPAKKQTLFFSATMPKEISQLVGSLLHDPVKIAVDPVSSPVEVIDQSVYLVDKNNKTKLLVKLVNDKNIPSALVFTRTKHGANRVAQDLTKAGITAAAIHGNKSQTARQQALSDFKAGNIRCLVATDIAARGLDIEELSHVFNYNLPEVPETYVHRIGRTGRAGKDGIAISFCDYGEKPLLRDIETLIGKSIPVVEDHPFPMQIFEAPVKDARGRVVNPEDAEARAAAKARKAERQSGTEDFLRFYRLLCKVIDSSPEGERGIPLGNVSSQDFANIYLNELDQFCIRFLGATLYTRYMDDVVVIAPNKEIAREWLAKIKVFLQERLHLETNQKTKIFYVRQGVNAYGFKIKATHLLLRTESKRREKRRIKRMMEKLQEGTITKAAIVQSVNSWLGFARWACAHNLAKKIFAPYRFIKTEGELPYGAISRNRQARRILQQRRGAGKTHKAVA